VVEVGFALGLTNVRFHSLSSLFLHQTGRFIPDKSNIWRDCVDGYFDWVKEHINEGAPLNEADHCGDPPLLLAAGNGHTAV